MSRKVKKIRKSEGDTGLKDKSTKKNISSSKKNRVGFFRLVVNFVKELKGELKKIVWPTKKGLVVSTFVVILAIVFMAIFVMFADYIFRGLLKTLLKTL